MSIEVCSSSHTFGVIIPRVPRSHAALVVAHTCPRTIGCHFENNAAIDTVDSCYGSE